MKKALCIIASIIAVFAIYGTVKDYKYNKRYAKVKRDNLVRKTMDLIDEDKMNQFVLD